MLVNFQIKTYGLFIALIVLLQACGGMPDKNQLLEQARLTYEQAESMPTDERQKYTLAEAKIALKQAEESQNKRDIEEFARIAIEKSKLAMENSHKQTITQKSQSVAVPQVAVESYETSNGLVFILPSKDLFAEHQVELENLAVIRQIAQFMQKNPTKHALIEGYTNQHDNVDFNQGLSYRRANAVRFALMRQGIKSNRLIVKTRQPTFINHSQKQYIKLTVINAIGAL